MTIDNYAAALLGRVKNTQGIAGREARAFGVYRLAGRRYGFYTADRARLVPTVREPIYALKTPEIVPEATFEAYRSFVPPQPATAVTEPAEKLTGTVSERIKASVTVLEFVSQYVDRDQRRAAPSTCARSTGRRSPASPLIPARACGTASAAPGAGT